MKKSSKILLGIFSLMVLFSMFSVNTVAAAQVPVELPSQDNYQGKLQANNEYQFRFRLRTQLRVMANVNVNVNIQCDAMKIGVKDFAIEVTSVGDLNMNMTCTEEQAELGLLAGNTYQIRNRNRLRYEEGFCIQIQSNATVQNQIRAKLMIQATNQNQIGTWAYYDEASEAWVSVPTTVQDGYLVADVDHFSYWTILIPDYTVAIIVGVSVGVGVLVAVLGIYFWRRRRD